ncbi:flagellar export chaperone FliS [Thermomicrobiaceae bacterium CFH 74404]|uniref:Flagellar secretion chaperone FliS n=1 Tax=Thermalbibacter longus TaxID=2951981 RepID=A0AA41WBF9_9BACT|nr:flagellar export chaperone FliS [Thermalbibacter longus]MCM8749726.1 flagellar export chaperone FliS [Thermalbibacter longus]
MAYQFDRYRQVGVETASPVDLVIMLYRGAIRFLAEAEEAIAARDIPEAHRCLVRSQEIIAELMGSLNLDAGELAINLSRLYDYMQQRLIDANVRKDPAGVVEVRSLLSELLDAWEAIAAQETSRRPVYATAVTSA